MKSDEVKTVRESLLLTQKEFAQKLGVTKLTISYWEKGLRHPSSLAVKAILMLKGIEKKGADNAQLIQKAFDKLNKVRFEGILTDYRIELTGRLKRFLAVAYPKRKLIRISLHYLEKGDWQNLEDILKHEMLHCFLYERGYPLGHSLKLKTMLRKIKEA
jgi:transcriptional regulator with XRE-family HTH domain